MKYWECINIPGKTGVVVSDDVENASSDESNYTSPVLKCEELTPEEMKEIAEIVHNQGNRIVEPMPPMFSQEYLDMCKGVGTGPSHNNEENIQPEITVGYTHEFVNNEKVDELSDEYKRAFNQAFNKGEVKVDSIPGTDAVSVSVPVDLPVTTENPSEENDNKYISADEVDHSKYDEADGTFEVPDLTPSDDSEIENNQLDKDSIKESLLAGIFGDVGEQIADKVVDKLAEKVSEPEVVQVEAEPEYSLDEKQLNDVVETFNRYEREYFGELTPEHFSTRFLRNIPKHVYRAHQDCVDKYESPDILDPLFFMYIMLTEDPYLAMGKFINIIRNKLKSDKTWSDAVDNLEIEYDEYVADFADEDEEDDADAPSEETTDNTSESND